MLRVLTVFGTRALATASGRCPDPSRMLPASGRTRGIPHYPRSRCVPTMASMARPIGSGQCAQKSRFAKRAL